MYSELCFPVWFEYINLTFKGEGKVFHIGASLVASAFAKQPQRVLVNVRKPSAGVVVLAMILAIFNVDEVSMTSSLPEIGLQSHTKNT